MLVSALVSLRGEVSERLRREDIRVKIANRDIESPSVQNYRFVRRFLERHPPTLVHCHSVVGLPFCCALADLGIPLVQHVHVADETALAELEQQLELAETVIAVSDYVKRRLVRCGVPAERIAVVYNCIPAQSAGVSNIDRNSMRRALEIPQGAPLLLMVARFAPNKRHDVAIEAFRMLLVRFPEAVLVLLGDRFAGQSMVFDRILDDASDPLFASRIRLVGFAGDVAPYYRAADVVILPSEDDPAPLVILEAMANGVPIVAADSGGSGELVSDGKTGMLVSAGRPDLLVESVDRLLSDRVYASGLVASAAVEVVDRFGHDRFVRQIVEIYRSVVPSRSPGEVVSNRGSTLRTSRSAR